MKLAASALLVLALSTGAAFAQGVTPTLSALETPDPVPRVSLTISPIHLIMPIVELAAEMRVAPRLSATVIAGGGRVSSGLITATAYEIGAQVNYYILSDFEGLHAGAEALYLSLGDVEQDSSLSGAGTTVGPYVGYKVMTSLGFTFVAQLGVAYLAVKAQSATQMESDKKVYPLLNLNAGWSF